MKPWLEHTLETHEKNNLIRLGLCICFVKLQKHSVHQYIVEYLQQILQK